MMKISFIIPIYNSSKTIHECIDSILALKFSNYEIILVDDGSTDKSSQICDEYASEYDNIKCIHQKNGGISAARNSGLDIADGEYIFHCDSDDSYDTKELDSFISQLERSKEITHFFGFNILFDGKKHGKYKYAEFTIENNLSYITSRKSHDNTGYAVWNKVYNKKLLDKYNIRSIERDKAGNTDDWCEDLFLNLQYFAIIDKITQTGLPCYCVRTHDKSEEQLNAELGSRIDHMFNLFTKLKQTDIYKNMSDDDFAQVFVWHIKRTFYDYLRVHSIAQARDNILSHKFGNYAVELIKLKLKDKTYFYDTYDRNSADDYMNLLRYFIKGNMTEYKIRNAFLWKIKAKGR